jgi:hypothetical protein
MKKCVRCGQTYSDDTLNFCLNDGELLVNFTGEEPRSLFPDEPPPTQFADDSPPTLAMDRARITNQTNWPQSSQPPAYWQGPSTPARNPSYTPETFNPSRDQTLPTISLVLGIFACFLVCCAGGIWLGLPAAVLGFLGMKNADSDPNRYSGRGMAIAGMVLGIVTFVVSMIFIVIGNMS